ncbi:MAG TPA: c-type cytochrome [Candidatus Angelobacter sp.]|nr:c-type cytochrome [Candidatus Angelobacter sp.]
MHEPPPSLDKYIGFDAVRKEVSVTNGAPEAEFTFNLTNISSSEVTINYIQGSCHCTEAQMPATPWKISPKQTGTFTATMQLAGVPPGGTKTKTLTVGSDKGFKILYVKTTVLPEPEAMTAAGRVKNRMMAVADRQAVFKGDCAQCHAATAMDSSGHEKMGQQLYAAVCGICHEAKNQASFVPNLHRLREPASAEFWKNWIMHGKPGTLMPAFAKQEGGILSDQQIDSLAQYLTATIPAHAMAASVNGVK